MINNTETLQFLYYHIHMPIIVSVIQIIIGIVIGFFAYRISKIMIGYVLGIYIGAVLGGMTGYIIYHHIISICVGAVIGGAIFALINNKVNNGYIFIITFTVFMQMTHIIIISFTNIFGINGYEVLGKYPDLLADYVSKDFALITALIVGIVVSVIMLKKKFVNKYYLIFTSFLGVIQIVGGIFAWSGVLFYMGGEWEEFFLPCLAVEYGKHTWWFLTVIIIAGTVLAFAQSNKTGGVTENLE